MRYRIETSYPKQPWWHRAVSVFRPGWYGGAPYFNAELKATDNIGRQHLRLTLQGPDGVGGNIIGYCHIPNGWKMVKDEK